MDANSEHSRINRQHVLRNATAEIVAARREFDVPRARSRTTQRRHDLIVRQIVDHRAARVRPRREDRFTVLVDAEERVSLRRIDHGGEIRSITDVIAECVVQLVRCRDDAIRDAMLTRLDETREERIRETHTVIVVIQLSIAVGDGAHSSWPRGTVATQTHGRMRRARRI